MKLSLPTLVLFLFLATGARALDLQQFLQETQRLNQGAQGISLVWWIPTAYWEESLKQSANTTVKQREEVTAALEPYTMFAIVQMKPGAFGTMKTLARAELLDAFDLKFADRTLVPTAETQISPEMRNLMSMLKPVMSNMLGQLGEGLEFVLFPNQKDGKKIIDPRGPGRIDVKFFDAAFHWRLPLGSLLPPRIDEKSGETFPGNYEFNPFTGDKLTTKK